MIRTASFIFTCLSQSASPYNIPGPPERPDGFSLEPVVGFVVGNAVAAARAKKGLSQKELAEITGIDQSDLSKIERGVANPSIGTLSRIAEAMDAELMVSIN